MTPDELENLVTAGTFKREPAQAAEIQALIRSGQARLRDAANHALAIESRFDLAYNAAHALALAALRRRGYRCDNRYVVFQALPHTAGVPAVTWRVLATAHGQRNLLEYEGSAAIDEGIVRDVIEAARAVERAVLAAR